MSVTQIMRPFSDQPKPGQRVRVFTKDGRELNANCTLITSVNGQFIQWYDKATRKAIDVNEIKGWMPT